MDWRVRWPRRGRVRNLSRGALAPCSRGGVAGSANTSRNDCRIRRCDTHKHDVPACMCAHKNAHTNTRAPTYARTIYATVMISRALSSAIHACLCACIRHADGFARAEAGYMEQAERRKWLAGSTACVVLLHGWQPPPPLPSSGEGRQGSAAASAASAAGVEGSTPGGRCCTLWCANVGDSRAVLCRGGKARRLSEDHKPERRDERKRVEAAGMQTY